MKIKKIIELKFNELKKFTGSNKKFSAVILIVLILGVYSLSKSIGVGTQTRYVIATARKTTVESLVTGSGQISTSDQVDIQPEVSGTVNYVAAKIGNDIKKGDIIAKLDNTDALRALQNAEISLSNSKITYDKALKKFNDQSADSLTSDLNQAYDNGYKVIANTFIDLPDINSGVNSIFYDPSHSPYFGDNQLRTYGSDIAVDYKYETGAIFDKFKNDYDSLFKIYRNTPPNIHSDEILSLLNQAYDLLKKLSLALNGTYNTIDYISARITGDKPAQISTDKNSLSTYISKVNSNLASIQNAITSIEDAKDSATTAELNLKSAELSLNQAQDSYKDAGTDLANHTIRAPFDGTIAKVSAENEDKVTTNSSVAVLITKEKIADISLNEVDISKVKVGQKVTVTFDAIDELTVTGEITEIDLLGTVSQGVVNYTVKVHLNTEDERIKSGMTVDASIVNDIRQDVIAVSSSAIKTVNGNSFLQVPDATEQIPANSRGLITLSAPSKLVKVTLGLSNDDVTEILDGIAEGDKYMAQTIEPTSGNTSSSTQAPSLFGGGGTRSTGSANTGAFLRVAR